MVSPQLFCLIASSRAVGRGHLARSLVLISALREMGVVITLLLEGDGAWDHLAVAAGFTPLAATLDPPAQLAAQIVAAGGHWLLIDRHDLTQNAVVTLHHGGVATIGLSLVGEGALCHHLLINPNSDDLPNPWQQKRIHGAAALLIDWSRLLAAEVKRVDILVSLGASERGATATPALLVALRQALPAASIAATSPAAAIVGGQCVVQDSEFLALLRGCGLFVCGFGNSLYEALALHRRVVVATLNQQQQENLQRQQRWLAICGYPVEDLSALVSAAVAAFNPTADRLPPPFDRAATSHLAQRIKSLITTRPEVSPCPLLPPSLR
jgi:hypothetical protein